MLEKNKIRGLETAWIQEGLSHNAPILFLIHGCPDDPNVWKYQIEKFKGHFTVVAPYLRGIGPSEKGKDKKRYRLLSMTLDFLEILNRVDPSQKQSIFILAHDLGVPYAFKLAHHLGDRLAGLIIINGPELTQIFRKFRSPRQCLKSWYIGFFQIPLLSDLVVRILEVRFKRKLSPFLPHYRSLLRELPAELKLKTPPLKKPTLFFWGKNDPYLEVPTQNEIRALSQNATLRVLDGSHWALREKHEPINRHLEDFFRENTHAH